MPWIYYRGRAVEPLVSGGLQVNGDGLVWFVEGLDIILCVCYARARALP